MFCCELIQNVLDLFKYKYKVDFKSKWHNPINFSIIYSQIQYVLNFIALAHFVRTLSCFQKKDRRTWLFRPKRIILYNDLDLLINWATVCGLAVNPRRTYMVLFLTKTNIPSIRLVRLKNCEIDLPRIARYLLDSKLSWNLKKYAFPEAVL